MAQSETEDAPSTDRRVRQVARDGLAAAAVSISASLALMLTLWSAVRGLG